LVSDLPPDPDTQDLQEPNSRETTRKENTDDTKSKRTTVKSLIPEEFDNWLDGKKYAAYNQEPDIFFEVIGKVDTDYCPEEYATPFNTSYLPDCPDTRLEDVHYWIP
jgi:hypothetical protein